MSSNYVQTGRAARRCAISRAIAVLFALSVALAVVALAGATAQAELISHDWLADNAYTVSNTDLLQTQLSSTDDHLVGSGDINGGNVYPGRLIDGVNTTNLGGSATGINSGYITYTLDTSVNTLGYDISAIATYSGWQDLGRVRQSYTVSYSTVDAPTAFIDIATVLKSTDNPGYSTFIDEHYGISDFTATGVGAIKFTFPAQQNGGVGYRELDVTGGPTVPEPSTLALLGAGVLGLVFCGWRRKR